MRRELPGGYELDDDPARLDLDAIWDFLSTEAYWGRPFARRGRAAGARGRAHDRPVPRGSAGRVRARGERRQVAYLADVYVLSEHRGHGLGVELVRASVDEGRARPAVAAPHQGRARPVRAVRVRAARATAPRAPAGRRADDGQASRSRTARPTRPARRSPCRAPRRTRSASTRSAPGGPRARSEARSPRPRAASGVRRAGCPRSPARAREAPRTARARTGAPG